MKSLQSESSPNHHRQQGGCPHPLRGARGDRHRGAARGRGRKFRDHMRSTWSEPSSVRLGPAIESWKSPDRDHYGIRLRGARHATMRRNADGDAVLEANGCRRTFDGRCMDLLAPCSGAGPCASAPSGRRRPRVSTLRHRWPTSSPGCWSSGGSRRPPLRFRPPGRSAGVVMQGGSPRPSRRRRTCTDREPVPNITRPSGGGNRASASSCAALRWIGAGPARRDSAGVVGSAKTRQASWRMGHARKSDVGYLRHELYCSSMLCPRC